MRGPTSGKRLTIGGLLPDSERGWAGVLVPNSKEAGIFGSMVSAQVVQTWSIRSIRRPATKWNSPKPASTNVQHYGGGEGLSAIDLLTPMLDGVEQGKAPEQIIARTAAPRKGPGAFGAPLAGGPPGAPLDGMPPGPPPGAMPEAPAAPKVQQSQPVYAYPHLALYHGSGDRTAAGSYRRSQQPARYAIPDWLGADFFKP